MGKRVSVCIPTYDGAKYIKELLDSILSHLGNLMRLLFLMILPAM